MTRRRQASQVFRYSISAATSETNPRAHLETAPPSHLPGKEPTDSFVQRFHAEAGNELSAVDKFRVAVVNDMSSGRLPADYAVERVTEEYGMMLAAVREKIRLTVGWNATSRMTEKERVRATANRVGLSVPEDGKAC